MNDPAKVRHVLQGESHIGATAQFSYMPWTGSSGEYPYMGWKLEFLDPTEPPAYFYLYPRVSSDDPQIEVYFGPHGDHTKDTLIGDVKGEIDEP